jgi:propanol-preferring alcohol dehydrogenase
MLCPTEFGTFAEYTVVPSRYVLELPEGLKDEKIAPILCGGVTVYKALKFSGANKGEWVAITGGGGGVGALGVQYAVAMGYKVIAIDGGDEKGRYCESLGASAYVDFATSKDIASAIKKTTGGNGVNAAIAVAGSGAAYRACFGMMAPFGTIVCVGIPPPTDLVSFHPLEIIDLGVRVIGSAVGTRGDVLEALVFVERGEVKPTVKTARLKQLNEIAGEFRKGTVC